MKTFLQIFAATTTIACVAAATGGGYLYTYTLPNCVTASGVTKANPYQLPAGKCVPLTQFTSFQGGIKSNCPKGKKPSIKAYSGSNCDGNSVDAGTLPSSDDPGSCQQITVASGSGSVSVAGQSAEFKCI